MSSPQPLTTRSMAQSSAESNVGGRGSGGVGSTTAAAALPIPLNLPRLVALLGGGGASGSGPTSVTINSSLRLQMKKIAPATSGQNHATDSVTASSSSQNTIRSLITTAPIAKGSVLATIPSACTLRGHSAHAIVQLTLGSSKYKRLLDFAARREEGRRIANQQKRRAQQQEAEDENDANKTKGGSTGTTSVASPAIAAKAKETFVSLSSRDCIIMLCALASTRVFVSQQKHIAAHGKKVKATQQQNNAKHSSSLSAPLPPTPLKTFAALRLSAPPPSWLVQWCKYGLPTRHFASAAAVIEGQKEANKLEKVERRRLNLIQDPQDAAALLLAAGDEEGGGGGGEGGGGGGDEAHEPEKGADTNAKAQLSEVETAMLNINRGIYPSPIPPPNYLGPKSPTTLLDSDELVRAGNISLSERDAVREPTHQLPTLSDIKRSRGVEGAADLLLAHMAAEQSAGGAITDGKSNIASTKRLASGSADVKALNPSSSAGEADENDVTSVVAAAAAINDKNETHVFAAPNRLSLADPSHDTPDVVTNPVFENHHQLRSASGTAAHGLGSGLNPDGVKPPLLVGLEREAILHSVIKPTVGEEMKRMLRQELEKEKGKEGSASSNAVKQVAANADPNHTALVASSPSSLSSPTGNGSSSSSLSTLSSSGPTSVEPFAPNRTRDLVEVVATPTMVAKFFSDQPLVLSEAKQRALAAHRYGERAGLEELALRSTALDDQLLRPLVRVMLGLNSAREGKGRRQKSGNQTKAMEDADEDGGEEKDVAADGDVDDDDLAAISVDELDTGLVDALLDGEVSNADKLMATPQTQRKERAAVVLRSVVSSLMEDLRWSHAMLRSRAVNGNWPSIGKHRGGRDGGAIDPLSLSLFEVNPTLDGGVSIARGEGASKQLKLVDPSLIPIVDLLNHAPPGQSNTTFVPSVAHVEVEAKDAAAHASTTAASFGRGGNEKNNNKMMTKKIAVPTPAFSIVATRDIAAGEMLTLNYGHYRQRTILFEEDPSLAAEELAAAVGLGGGGGTLSSAADGSSSSVPTAAAIADAASSVPNASRERLAVALDMKRIEDLQRFGNSGPRSRQREQSGMVGNLSSSSSSLGAAGGAGGIDDDALNDAKAMSRSPRSAKRRLDESVTEQYFERNAIEAYGGGSSNNSSSSASSSSPLPARGTPLTEKRPIATRKFSGLSDADWSWYFGFTKSQEEKQSEARQRFEKDLTRRVAGMLDNRVRGKKGEYVVGVPAGVLDLQAHRARLQQEQYGGHAVFPPQRV